jgi:hypothetical protein
MNILLIHLYFFGYKNPIFFSEHTETRIDTPERLRLTQSRLRLFPLVGSLFFSGSFHKVFHCCLG